jgi:hypothetical protein
VLDRAARLLRSAREPGCHSRRLDRSHAFSKTTLIVAEGPHTIASVPTASPARAGGYRDVFSTRPGEAAAPRDEASDLSGVSASARTVSARATPPRSGRQRAMRWCTRGCSVCPGCRSFPSRLHRLEARSSALPCWWPDLSRRQRGPGAGGVCWAT